MNIGVDLGWTIKGVRMTGDRNKIAPDSFRVLKRLIDRGDKIFIISKVNSEQKERAEKWLKDVRFFEETGINPDNLYFCFEKRDKAMFVKSLDIDVMIDDRAEVMKHLPTKVLKFLITPEIDELRKFQDDLRNFRLVYHWSEIEEVLFV